MTRCAWLIEQPWNNLFLIIVGVWLLTGFAMVILSAGLKGISAELLEAARVDGANERQVFRRIVLPLLAPTIAVVATTVIIYALKTFDVVYTMTNGNFDTNVIANLMYQELFNNGQPGRAAAVAVILFAGDRPGDVREHPALPRAGGDPMTGAPDPGGRGRRGQRGSTAHGDSGRVRASVGGFLHLSLIVLMVIWAIPTIALLVASFRPAAGDEHERLVDGHSRRLGSSPSRTTSTSWAGPGSTRRSSTASSSRSRRP